MFFCEIYEFFKTDVLRNNRNACTRAAIRFFLQRNTKYYSCTKRPFVFLQWNTKFYSFTETAISQSANIGPQDVPRMSPSNVPRTSPKDLIWPSWGRPDLTSRGRLNLTSWGPLGMTSRGRPNLTFKGRPSEVDSGHPQDVLRTAPRGSSEYSNLDIPAFFVTFLSELIWLTKSI